MNNVILITGATGVLGRAMVSAAIDAGLAVRQGVRNPNKANPAAPAVPLDWSDPSTIAPAVAGAWGLLLMAPPLDPNAPAQLGQAIAAARDAGVQHVVLISAFGVNHNEQAPLRVVEHMVIDSGIPYTILRPNFFLENFSEGFLAAGIRDQSAIYLAAGDGKTSFISVADIAAAAVASFRAPLTGQELDLTGPEALDHAEVARIISDTLGRTVTYHALTEEQMLAGARAHSMPESAVTYLGILYSAVRAGYAAGVTNGVQQVTGRPPIRVAEFAKAAVKAWR